MLGYLQKLTLQPDEINPADVASLYAAGIGQEAINEASYICAIFNIIDRIADAFNFHVPPTASARGVQMIVKRGYSF